MSSRPSAFTLTQPGRLRLYSTKELIAMPPPEWQIDGLFPKGGFVVLYGPPGSYKSFVAADMGCAIASRIGHWQHHAAEPGHVLYVAAEGGSGMGKRLGGWSQAHAIDPSQIDISWLLESFPMQANSEDMSHLLARLIEIDTRPSLIIIDTLARCYLGDENMQEDMNAFIAGVDQLRGELHCTVLVVHHTRLDGDRERGNTALRGAADAMIAVTGTDRHGVRTVSLTNDKQKDEARSGLMRFSLVPDPVHNTLVLGPYRGHAERDYSAEPTS